MTFSALSQSDGVWSPNTESRSAISKDKAVARQSYPETFTLFNLNAAALKQQLFSVVGKNATKQSTIISLPNADGGIEKFEIFEASNFEPELQARFPEIRAYSGKGITDKYATLKLSISPQGLQTMVFRTETDNEFIEPFSQDRRVYSVYKANRKKGDLPWTCTTEDRTMFERINGSVDISSATGSSTGLLKTMRLAQSCTAEYSNYFGATSSAQVNLVLAAYNNTLTRCNGIYEKDLALHLNLIANTTAVIYYNPSTDPYSSTNSWGSELQSTLTSVIGEANYDIGHLFGSTGGGGNAGCIGCVCVNGSKGKGYTSPADGIPQGDNFDIDYVVHEVGHQLGANHTFSQSNENTGVNKEVGSGITIMGYAGITAQDVAPHSIDIFHQTSIAQIQANLATKTCPISSSANNAAPVIAALNNYTIPINTPFALTGSATDVNNDAITYNWEQNDNSTTTGTGSVASPTKATGPNFLTFPSTTSGTRIFPRLSTVLAGANVTGPLAGGDAGANIEALSSVSRTLNFRLTVRDNRLFSAGQTIGQTSFADAVVTVTNTAGPFQVTSPNTNITWAAGSAETVTWNVNATNAGSVNCQTVNILLSTDGGQTFPITLASGSANDGSATITVPLSTGTTNRIKVESVGNIFFDISNTDFTIGAPPACPGVTGLTTSAITETSATFNWTPVSGANNYDVDYKASTSSIWINVVTASTASTASRSGLTAGTTYDWRVRANCTAGAGSYSQAQFTTAVSPSACPGALDISTNGTISGAATIPLNTDVRGRIEARNDVDYFRFSTATTGTVTLSLTSLPADYHLALHNSAGAVISTSANIGTTDETLTATVTGGQVYYARVYPRSNKTYNANLCYTLRVQTGTASRNAEAILFVSNKFSVAPNPAGYSVNLSFNAKANGSGTVTIINQTGAVVLNKTLVVNAGDNLRRLDVGHLPNGMYFIKIQTGVITQMTKLVIGK